MEGQGAVAPTADPAEVIGRRIGAALVDVALMTVLFVVVGIALGAGESSDDGASIVLDGGQTLVYFALVLLYYFATEATSGQTLGKRLFGLVVIRREGGPAGAGPIAIRTVLRVVDALPFLYLLGLIVMLATPAKQRLGDLAAGTVVIARAPRQPPYVGPT